MRRIVLAAVVLFGFGSHAFGQAAPDPATLCAPPDRAAKVIPYEIDLATATPGTKVHYRTSDEVQVIFKNKNPFLFDYRIKIDVQALPEPGLETFFKVFSTSSTASLLAAISPGQLPNFSLPEDQEQCEAALKGEAIKRLEKRQKELLDAYTALKASALTNEQGLEKLKGAIKDQEKPLQDTSAVCDSLVKSALSVTKTIREGLDDSQELGKGVTEFNKNFEEFKKGVSSFETLIAAARIVLADAKCKEGLINQGVAVFEASLTAFKVSLDPKNEKGLQKVSSDLEATVKEIKDREKDISDILKHPDLFQSVQQIGDYDDITQVKITVYRKKREEKDYPSSHYLFKELRFGGRQRFTLAAGAAFSGIETTTYKAIQGIELDESGEPVPNKPVTRVVGLDEKSNQRVTPLIMLHTRIFEIRSWISGVHFSFGFAGSTANNGLNLEYLIGPSISFAEERFFLTFGAYNGRTEKLAKGFFLGKPLDNSIPSVPIFRGRSWDWGMAATYKFR